MSPDHELVDALARRINPADPQQAMAQLHGSPLLEGDGEWLRSLIESANALSGPEVSPELHVQLIDLFAAHASPEPRWAGPVEDAVSIIDTRMDAELAGVRGDAPSPAHTMDRAWSIVFSAPSAEVIIDGTPGDGATSIEGQLLRRHADSEPARVRVDGADATIPVDDLGRFALGSFAPGSYAFHLEGARFGLQWSIEVTG